MTLRKRFFVLLAVLLGVFLAVGTGIRNKMADHVAGMAKKDMFAVSALVAALVESDIDRRLGGLRVGMPSADICGADVITVSRDAVGYRFCPGPEEKSGTIPVISDKMSAVLSESVSVAIRDASGTVFPAGRIPEDVFFAPGGSGLSYAAWGLPVESGEMGSFLAGGMIFLSVLFALSMVGFWIVFDRAVLSRVERTMDMARSMRKTGDVRLAALRMDKSGPREIRMLQSVLIGMASKFLAARRRAEKAVAIRSRFLANLSHEIRTPLNAIIGFSRVLSEHTPEGDVADMVRDIRVSADHLLGIISDVLDMSKMEAGGLDLCLVETDVRGIIEEAVSVYGCRAAESDLVFDMSIGENVPKTVIMDPVRVKQVVGNLLSNAIKYTRRGSVILSVGFIEEDSRITVSVKDTGIGLRNTVTIFDPFIQADGAKAGVGLGLSICRHLAEKMGGSVVAKRLPGGSLFRFVFPVKVVDKPGNPVDKGDHVDQGLSGVRALFAEDNAMNVRLLERITESLGLSAKVVGNGRAAVDIVSGGGVDIVFMDLNMPGMDGLEATREIRLAGSDVPIIALTAHAMDKDRKRCLDAGMDGYVSKPFRKEEIADAIRKHVAR